MAAIIGLISGWIWSGSPPRQRRLGPARPRQPPSVRLRPWPPRLPRIPPAPSGAYRHDDVSTTFQYRPLSVISRAAVDVYRLPGDEAAIVGNQEQAGRGDFVDLALTAKRNAGGVRHPISV